MRKIQQVRIALIALSQDCIKYIEKAPHRCEACNYLFFMYFGLILRLQQNFD